MKPIHIVGIVVIAVAIAMIMSTAGDASQYVSFKEATTMAQNGNNVKIHVVGKLRKDKNGQVQEMYYNPAENPNYFTFTLIDNNNQPCTVVYNNPVPADFERSEQVVVIGAMRGNKFFADKILMKCPSKYQDENVEMKEKKKAQS
ncbi:MAG: cytochrome c maturation protein CcmE [Microscillaceae bacterium]|jgi:cytochrome c-type biogenesis protein CcmE|nr:cytochrome c maturation protein CcmE [Microscillaceae bacterium]